MKALAMAIGALLLLITLAGVGVGWYFSESILKPQPYSLLPEFELIDVDVDSVTLPLPTTKQFGNTKRAGIFNLLWEGGYGRLGEIIREDDVSVTRELSQVIGSLPQAGRPARLDAFVFRRDPFEDHGLEFETLTLAGEVGALQAWWLASESDTAVLMLHGRRRGDITETLRAMPTLVTSGYSVLSLSYRNHSASDPSPDGFYHYGASEWRDAVTGLEYLHSQGIRKVVLYGFSMGGAVALETLKRYPNADVPRPVTLIMDAPLLDPRTVFRQGARDAGIPLPEQITDLALFISRLRSGINWQQLDQRQFAADVPVPTLVFTGVNDSTIPVSLVDEFAAHVSDITYHRVAGAEHVEAWNENPRQYEAWLNSFLSEYATPSPSPQAAD